MPHGTPKFSYFFTTSQPLNQKQIESVNSLTKFNFAHHSRLSTAETSVYVATLDHILSAHELVSLNEDWRMYDLPSEDLESFLDIPESITDIEGPTI